MSLLMAGELELDDLQGPFQLLPFYDSKGEGQVWPRHGRRRRREGWWWGREEDGVGRVTFAALVVAWDIGRRTVTVTPCTL